MKKKIAITKLHICCTKVFIGENKKINRNKIVPNKQKLNCNMHQENVFKCSLKLYGNYITNQLNHSLDSKHFMLHLFSPVSCPMGNRSRHTIKPVIIYNNFLFSVSLSTRRKRMFECSLTIPAFYKPKVMIHLISFNTYTSNHKHH